MAPSRMDRYVPLPPLPTRISRLNDLAYDLWWSWNPKARKVFRSLDYPLWRFTDHNPVLLLHLVEVERLDYAATDGEFLQLYDEAIAALDTVRAGAGTWWASRRAPAAPVAWIARQFALHQSLPIYTTSEGVLSGDFCKEASDLGVPLVGVGLMFPRAYSHQRLSEDGWQQDRVEYIDWSDAPVSPALRPDGSPYSVVVKIGTTEVHASVWQVRTGRATVYLLDTDVDPNAEGDRDLSTRRCAGDPDVALRQSVLLGAGAVAVFDQLGIEPSSWHLSEGHATTVVLERLSRLVAGGRSFDDALMAVRASTMFTSMSDAPNEGGAFSFAALERHLASAWPSLVPHRGAVLGFGRHQSDRGETFNARVLGTRTTAPPPTSGEGVHLSSWISADLARVFDQWVGEDWRERQDEDATWRKLSAVPDDQLWTVRQTLRGYLVDFIRERARRRWSRDRASGSWLVALGTLLDGSSLTIGCAPRFDGSMHAELLFHDIERLARIVTEARQPVQIVFAGRAESGHDSAKHHIQRVFRQIVDPVFGGRLAFLEDYDLHVARLMLQGCDAWLSVPPYRGGPSLGAIKAAVNGVPHLGPASAWVAGAFTGGNGWLLEPRGRDDGAQARAVYSAIEEWLVPDFYSRDKANVGVAWAGIMRRTIMSALPRFSARRAVKVWSAGPPLVGSAG